MEVLLVGVGDAKMHANRVEAVTQATNADFLGKKNRSGLNIVVYDEDARLHRTVDYHLVRERWYVFLALF